MYRNCQRYLLSRELGVSTTDINLFWLCNWIFVCFIGKRINFTAVLSMVCQYMYRYLKNSAEISIRNNTWCNFLLFCSFANLNMYYTKFMHANYWMFDIFHYLFYMGTCFEYLSTKHTKVVTTWTTERGKVSFKCVYSVKATVIYTFWSNNLFLTW